MTEGEEQGEGARPGAEPPDAPRRRLSTRQKLWRAAKVSVPLAFLGFTAWNVGDVVSDGTPEQVETASEEDSESTRDQITIAAAGDIGSDGAGEQTLRAMGDEDADVYVALGDLSYAGPGSEEQWCRLVRSAVGPVAPFQIVAGNHEDDTGGDGHVDGFAACLPDRLQSEGTYGREYYFDLGDIARVIMISPDLTIDGTHYFYGEGNANIQWVEKAIDGARESGIRWVIVGMHKNCISVGEYYCNVYQDLFSLLIEKRVDLVLSGHDHSYQRSKQLAAPAAGCQAVVIDTFDPDCVADEGDDDEYEHGEGPVFLITGAAGGELYELDDTDPEADYFASTMGANHQPRHGFSLLTVSEDELEVEFIGSSPGSFTDSFVITDSGGDSG